MTDPARFEARLEQVEADASAALHLARAHDRDLAELPLRMDANRRAINALGVQTAERFNQMDQHFDRMDRRFNQMDQRFDRLERRVDTLEHTVDAGFAQVHAQFDQVAAAFADIRGRLDGTAAGLEQIVRMLTPPEPGAAG